MFSVQTISFQTNCTVVNRRDDLVLSPFQSPGAAVTEYHFEPSVMTRLKEALILTAADNFRCS